MKPSMSPGQKKGHGTEVDNEHMVRALAEKMHAVWTEHAPEDDTKDPVYWEGHVRQAMKDVSSKGQPVGRNLFQPPMESTDSDGDGK
jgi:hypothetical protein